MDCLNEITFRDFCEKYTLKGTFVDSNYEMIWLMKPDISKLNKDLMLEFMNNNIRAIANRDVIISKHIHTGEGKMHSSLL